MRISSLDWDDYRIEHSIMLSLMKFGKYAKTRGIWLTVKVVIAIASMDRLRKAATCSSSWSMLQAQSSSPSRLGR